MKSRPWPWMTAAAIAACAWSLPARADQCAVLDEEVATRAVDLLRRHPDIVAFCEPCGEAAPGVPARLARVAAQRAGAGFEVVVDDRPIDLAYTYVQTSSHRYDNLAALVACPTTDVSPSLAIDDATATGVLIHADPRPRPAPVIAELAPPVAIVSSSHVTEHAAPPSSGIGWDAIAVACGATSALWWLGAAGLRRRRQRRMRPRAIEL
jgi:hypothetical protein